MAAAEGKKKKSIFWRIYAIGLVLVIIAAVLLLNYGKKVMHDYDDSQSFPLKYAKKLAADFEAGDYSLLLATDDFVRSLPAEREEYARGLSAAIRENGGCDVKRGYSADAVDKPTFIISAGKTRIATVVYEMTDEKTKYGFSEYRLLSITPFAEGSYAVKVLVPENCDFILDGQPVPEKYRTGEAEVITGQDDPSGQGHREIKAYYYYVGGMMAEPEFSVVLKETGEQTYLRWDGSMGVWTVKRYAVKALVPEYCDLVLDGQVITEDHRTGETVASVKAADDFERSSENDTQYYYVVEGLLEEPTTVSIVYKDTGKAADMFMDENTGAWTVITYEVSAEAPSNFTVFVNGKQISGNDNYTVEKNIEIPELDASLKYTDKKVTMSTFHVSGLRYRDDAKVTFKDFEGNEVEPVYSEEKGAFTAAAGITPRDIGVYGIDDAFLIMRAVNYARFVNNDGKYWEILKPYLLPGSDVYKEFESFWVTFSAHNEYWTENESVDELVFYHEGIFCATVSFDYWIKGFNHQTDNVRDYPTSITFWYVKSNGQWMIFDYSLNNG